MALSPLPIVSDELSGKWSKEETELTLNRVTLSASKGKLIAIIGSVGSEKSSILQAVLGEFPNNQGRVSYLRAT